MSFALPERQEILFCSCPKNAGNLRQFTCYCRQVGLLIAWPIDHYHYHLRFPLPQSLSARTVILSSQSPRYLSVLYYLRDHVPLLSELCTYLCVLCFKSLLYSHSLRLKFLNSSKSPPPEPSSFHPPTSRPATAVQIPPTPTSAWRQFPSSIRSPAFVPRDPVYPPAPA